MSDRSRGPLFKMANTKTVFSTSSACRQNSKFTASIISPTTVVLTIHKSRSTSALSELQQEVRQYELATSTRDGNDDSLHRSQSLPSRLRALTHHATQEAFVGSCEEGLLPGEHEGGQDTAEQEESTAVASNSRVSQLEAELQSTRMTATTLEKTIHHMKVYIDTLERQLKDEAQNNELLIEELEASKKLCCELHEACSRGDMPSSKLSSLHLVNDVASVYRSVQTLQQVEQETEPTRSPDQGHVTGIEHRTNGRPWDHEDNIETLENEIATLQQRCREKDYRVQAIAQQLSRYVHRDSYLKLEAKRASLESNLQRANRKARSLEQKQVYSKAFLDEMMWEMQGLQDVKVSLSKENSGLKNQAARHVAEVSILKEKLHCSNQERRAFKCKIDILNELLHNKQGEVTQKDSALETKNTILEAIKTIAYTSPSPVLSSNEWEDAEDMAEQHTSTDIGTHCDNRKAVNRRQSTTRRNGCDVGGHNARPSKTCNKPSSADNSRRVSCKGSYKDAVQADQQSEIYTSDTGSWETDTSGPYQVASSSSTSYQDLCEQETSHDRRNDFIDEEEDDNESLLDSELSLGEGECVKYGVEAEGLLLRKQEQENYAMRSRDRCWHYVYVVQSSTALMFYETREHKTRGKTLHDESPIDLIDALVTVAVEYTRRKHVFRVRLKTGKQYLFQARDDREMLYWVSCMDSAARCQVALTNGVPPSIASVSAPQLGSPSKSDRIKNAIKSSLSALIK